MKAYTDLEQSKKLAEILPVESADMCYRPYREEGGIPDYQATLCPYLFASWIGIPCWSLAVLLDQLEDVICDEEDNQWELVIKKEGVQYDLYYLIVYGEKENIELDRFYDDLIDACVEMIVTLKEKNLL